MSLSLFILRQMLIIVMKFCHSFCIENDYNDYLLNCINRRYLPRFHSHFDEPFPPVQNDFIFSRVRI